MGSNQPTIQPDQSHAKQKIDDAQKAAMQMTVLLGKLSRTLESACEKHFDTSCFEKMDRRSRGILRTIQDNFKDLRDMRGDLKRLVNDCKSLQEDVREPAWLLCVYTC